MVFFFFFSFWLAKSNQFTNKKIDLEDLKEDKVLVRSKSNTLKNIRNVYIYIFLLYIFVTTRKKKKKKKKKNSVVRRPPSFADPTRNDSHTTPSPQPTTLSTIRIPAKGEKTENCERERERERDFGQTSASVQFLRRALKPPSNRHQTTCYHHEKDP